MAKPRPLSPALQQLVDAARAECPPGHADALAALLQLAAIKVPSRGIFPPGIRDERELEQVIDGIAIDHLGYRDARKAWNKALKALPATFEQRDAVETAALNLLDVRETTTFYVGLAFGLLHNARGKP